MTTARKRFRVIGLMSGTSMDGIDVAFLETDGESFLGVGAFESTPYPDELRRMLLRLPADGVDIESLERDVTDLHSHAVRTFCTANGIALDSIDLVGFHGQRRRLAAPVKTAEDFGWNGNAIEAQAFAYLAVRSVLDMPLSWPSTTGVAQAVSGGVRCQPNRRSFAN